MIKSRAARTVAVIGKAANFSARRHNLARPRVAEFDHRFDQFALIFFDNAFGFAHFDQSLNVVVARFVAFFRLIRRNGRFDELFLFA